jgi:hypothetical protein
MKLREWLHERELNARRLGDRARSDGRGDDAAGWLEDADYFRRAVEAVDELAKAAPRIINPAHAEWCPAAQKCICRTGGVRPSDAGGG